MRLVLNLWPSAVHGHLANSDYRTEVRVGERLRKMVYSCERLFGALQGRRQAFPLLNQSGVARLSLIQFLRLPLAFLGADEAL